MHQCPDVLSAAIERCGIPPCGSTLFAAYLQHATDDSYCHGQHGMTCMASVQLRCQPRGHSAVPCPGGAVSWLVTVSPQIPTFLPQKEKACSMAWLL